MSTFQVTVQEISEIHPIPDADRIEMVQVRGFQCVTAKGRYHVGDKVAYIPEASVVPDEIAEFLGVLGKLSGSQKNRVKATSFRSCLSQGLVYPAKEHWVLGQDVKEELGITKYEPPIPAALTGEMKPAGSEYCWKYDIENFKWFPKEFKEGEEVVCTEKLHGTFSCVAVIDQDIPGVGSWFASSKGLFGDGLVFKHSDINSANAYYRMGLKLHPLLRAKFPNQVAYLFGEIIGVQDLKYGCNSSNLGYRAFDIYVGMPRQGRFLNDAELEEALKDMGIERVPVLYRGPYSYEKLVEVTTGKETLTGSQTHLREGCVIRPTVERTSHHLGRVQLKSVSADYLNRRNKDATEFN